MSLKETSEKISQDDPCLIIGQMAVKYKFVNDRQLREALSFQKQSSQKSLLGEIFVIKEMISQNQLDFLISVQNFSDIRKLDRRFGAITVQNGFATPEEINLALDEQSTLFKRTESVKLIGDILLDLEILTKEQRDAVLLRQQRLALLLANLLALVADAEIADLYMLQRIAR